MRATIGGSESGGAGGGPGDRGRRRKARFGSVARSHGEHHGGERVVGRSGGPRTGSAAAVSGGDGWIESAAGRLERVFGEQVEVQRCQIHKRRNVKEYLPENCQKDYDRRMRNAYAMNNYVEAQEALQKIFRQLERINR